MKTFGKIAKYIIAITVLVGGFTFVSRSEKLKKVVTSFNEEKQAYQDHHRPTPNWYYTVESVSTYGGKTFIIGRNMQSTIKKAGDGEVTVSLQPNGQLREIEVPNKKVGLTLSGGYFTVKSVDGQTTLIYFVSETEVIRHMIQARDTSKSGT